MKIIINSWVIQGRIPTHHNIWMEDVHQGRRNVGLEHGEPGSSSVGVPSIQKHDVVILTAEFLE